MNPRSPSPVLPRLLRAGGFLVLLAAGAALLAGYLLGARLVPVLTGSMTPYAPAGSLVLTVPVAGSDVAVGDVVAFRPPAPFVVSGGHPILHRVARLGTVQGQTYMITKGDANPQPDPWQVATWNEQFGRTVLVVPLAGRLLAGGSPAALGLGLGGIALLLGAGGLRRTAPVRGRHRAGSPRRADDVGARRAWDSNPRRGVTP